MKWGMKEAMLVLKAHPLKCASDGEGFHDAFYLATHIGKCDDSVATAERRCLSHEGSGNRQQKGGIFAMKAVGAQQKGGALATQAVGAQQKGDALATKALETHKAKSVS